MSVSNNIKLAPGEQGLYARDFRPNLLFYWLRSTMLVTNKRLLIKAPNSFLGIIPMGFQERSMPIGAIAGTTTSRTVKVGPLLLFAFVAVCFLFGSINMFEESVGAALMMLLLALIFGFLSANSVLSSLEITNNGGGTTEATVSFVEASTLEEFREKANEIIYSASAGGQSWDMAYGSNTEGFQNRIGAAGGASQYNPQGGFTQQQFGGPQFGGQQYGAPQGQYGNPQAQFGGPQGQQYGGQQYGNPQAQYGGQQYGAPQGQYGAPQGQQGGQYGFYEQPQQRGGSDAKPVSGEGTEGDDKGTSDHNAQ